MFTFNFLVPARTQLKILKPSLPDPIFLYADSSDYRLYSFKVSARIASPEDKSVEELAEKTEFSELSFKLDRPESIHLEENNLRTIRWV